MKFLCSNHSGSTQGFLLIELLMAGVVLASFTLSMTVFITRAVYWYSTGSKRLQALVIAQNMAEQVWASGKMPQYKDEQYTVAYRTKRVPHPPAIVVPHIPHAFQQVIIEVAWTERDGDKRVILTTGMDGL